MKEETTTANTLDDECLRLQPSVKLLPDNKETIRDATEKEEGRGTRLWVGDVPGATFLEGPQSH